MRLLQALVIVILIQPISWSAGASYARQAGKESSTDATKPPLPLQQFFSAVSIGPLAVSPDGQRVVIQTTRADWAKSIFRKDLWLYREGQGLIPLTHSEGDFNPQWSPDGRWIAFLSTRRLSPPGAKRIMTQATTPADQNLYPSHVPQVYAIRADGGEAVRLTRGSEGVHAFAWSSDSHEIFYATRIPWTKQREAVYKKEWHDVIQYREHERGDLIQRVRLPAAPASPELHRENASSAVMSVARTPFRVDQMTVSPDGHWLALVTEPPSLRIDSIKDYGIDLLDLRTLGTSETTRDVKDLPLPRVLVHRQCIPEHIQWSPDSQRLFFAVEMGSVEGRYHDVQPRVYSVQVTTGAIARWAAHFGGAVNGYAATSTGGVVVAGRLGTQVQIYSETGPAAPFTLEKGWPGTYQDVSAASHSSQIAFVYSTLTKPTEVYLASGPGHLAQARPITSFNEFLSHFALPRGRPFRWKADDGTMIEGMLVFPPGKFGKRRLPMFTFIHGGPEDADGDHFEADWYQWAALAATQGWLVFEPNYRGSTGYGDKFVLQIVPDIVSRPGKDILEGIRALIQQGYADPQHLAVGGYSYGGYMTDWLITQSTEFKAAVTGAGAIENAVNWGNDDMSYDDAYMLEGMPWQAEANYNREAALWQMNEVTTPTHIVAGADDIRVYVGEDYLLERCLYDRGIPTTLLVFPGEGHSLSNNPWHGRIKVREELKWLNKYGLGE